MKLTELKPGDTVVIQQSSGFHARPYLFATVKEVGAKKIKTDHGDYSTAHGGEWGKERYRSDFIREDVSIEEAQQQNAELEQDQRRRDLGGKFNNMNWRELPLEVLEQVDAIVTAATLPPAEEGNDDERTG
jgi:hypothetical protein